MDPISFPLSGTGVFGPEGLRLLEQRALADFVQRARWFGGKARAPRSFTIQELIRLPGGACALAFVAAEYADGARETYALPLELSQPDLALPESVLARLEDGCLLIEGTHGEHFRAALLRLVAADEVIAGQSGKLFGHRGSAMPAEAVGGLPSRLLKVEQSNSSIIYTDPAGEAGQAGVLFLKLFRKLEPGLNPDVEITRFLAERRGFAHVPPFGGVLEYHRAGEEPQVVALALGLVANEGDAWSYALKEVRRFYERVLEAGVGGKVPAPLEPAGSIETSPVLQKLIGDFHARVAQLGQRTGEMHVALASDSDDPAFAPEPLTMADQRALGAGLRASISRAARMLEDNDSSLVRRILADLDELLRRADNIAAHPVRTEKIRTHGDFHLGQVLNTGSDFVIIDFEGEPQRPLAERRAKRSPLRDVAGMLRSFHYAAHSDIEEFPEQREALEPWAEAWTGACSRAYLQAWRTATHGAAFVPASPPDFQRLLDAFLLEKAIYEVEYELNNRPAWLPIPLRGILRLLGTPERA